MLISTSLRIASVPAATWAINRSSGPRTAARDAELGGAERRSVWPPRPGWVCPAERARTGEANGPDCEQKWLEIPQAATGFQADDAFDSTSGTSASAPRGSAPEQLLEPGRRVAAAPAPVWFQALTALQHLLAGNHQNVQLFPPSWPSFVVACRLRHQVLPCIGHVISARAGTTACSAA